MTIQECYRRIEEIRADINVMRNKISDITYLSRSLGFQIDEVDQLDFRGNYSWNGSRLNEALDVKSICMQKANDNISDCERLKHEIKMLIENANREISNLQAEIARLEAIEREMERRSQEEFRKNANRYF